MCPLRFILVFLSATLAGYFAWKSFRSDPPQPEENISGEQEQVETEQNSGFWKVFGGGFWVFVDMASGRYLWKNLKTASKGGEKAKAC